MNSATYIKIALFFLILGGAGAGYVILSADGISALNTNTYEAVLLDASGLSTRSKVYLAGVEVGKVQNIQLSGTEARIRFVVFKDVELRRDAAISRKSSSLLGTSVLSLDPGTELTPIIPSGSFINTAPVGGDMDAALGMVQDIGSQLSFLLEEFRMNQMALLAVSIETFNSIAQKIDAQSEAELVHIARILESAALISERTERILRSSEGDIFGSVEDVHEALANMRAITDEITAGRGSLGQTIYDTYLYETILATVEKTEDAAGKLEEALDNISALAKTADGVVASAGEVVDKALGLGIQVDSNARYDTIAGTAKAAASIRLEPASNDRWYRIGVASSPDGDTNRTVIDAELARRFGYLTIRGGFLEGSAGFGMDVQPFNWMSLSGELFQFTKGEAPNLRGTLTFYPFFNPDSDKPWNWIYLLGGINNALNENRDYFFGGGVRFADREVRGLVGLLPVLGN